MTSTPAPVLVTGAGGGVGGVGHTVVRVLRCGGLPVRAMVHRDDARADALRSTGAQVIVGDLTRPDDVGRAIDGAGRAYFSMSVSPDYLEAAATFATVALDLGQLDAVVNMSQMTVSQMTSTSTDESPHQRLHYLAERILDWSGLPVVHIRPTVFLDNPFFTTLAARSIADSNTLSLPFGSGRTSPISAGDVARVVATILTNPAEHVGQVYELTGPRAQSMTEVAAEFTTALGRPVTYTPAPFDDWLAAVEGSAGIDPHVLEHLATMARLHAEGRYDRATETVQRLTGQRPQSVADFVTEHRARYDK